MTDKRLDAQNLLCPLPILMTKKALAGMARNQVIEVLATDPGSTADFEAFCRATGHTLVEQSAAGGVYRFLIRHTAA